MLKLAAIVTVISVTSAVSASAIEYQRDPTEIRVSSAGVDFTDPAQAAMFHHRLARAARMACDSGIDEATVEAADARCARDSLERAVAGLHKPLLTAYHSRAARQARPVELAHAGR